MTAKKMTYAEWQAYQRTQMSWLASRIGDLQATLWILESRLNAHQFGHAVSRETNEDPRLDDLGDDGNGSLSSTLF